MFKNTLPRPRQSLLLPTLLLDAVVVSIMGIVNCYIVLGGFPWNLSEVPSKAYMILIFGTSLAVIPIFAVAGPSVFTRGVRFWWLLRQTLYGVFVLSVLVVGVLFVTKLSITFSRLWFGLWMASSCFGLVFARLILICVLNILRRRNINQKGIVIVGDGPMGRLMAVRIHDSVWSDFRLVGIFDRRGVARIGLSDVPYFNNFDELPAFVEENDIQEVWIALPLSAEKHIEKIVEEMVQTTVTIRFVPDTFGLRLTQNKISEIHGIQMFNLSASRMDGVNRLTKATLDYSLAFCICAIIGPLVMLPIACAVKFSSKGPIFFRQKRHGWDGRKITVYKFRTMYQHREKCGLITQASKNDPRITPIGKFLRRTSLDELPQFINVLQGRMSIVGPRPHPLELNETYKKEIRHYMRRHKVKPGITGFAQIKGWRGETDTVHKMRKRVQYDFYYLENWTIGFDIKIIWLTLFSGFIHQNAR